MTHDIRAAADGIYNDMYIGFQGETPVAAVDYGDSICLKR
jgi:hypothetical protein